MRTHYAPVSPHHTVCATFACTLTRTTHTHTPLPACRRFSQPCHGTTGCCRTLPFYAHWTTPHYLCLRTLLRADYAFTDCPACPLRFCSSPYYLPLTCYYLLLPTPCVHTFPTLRSSATCGSHLWMPFVHTHLPILPTLPWIIIPCGGPLPLPTLYTVVAAAHEAPTVRTARRAFATLPLPRRGLTTQQPAGLPAGLPMPGLHAVYIAVHHTTPCPHHTLDSWLYRSPLPIATTGSGLAALQFVYRHTVGLFTGSWFYHLPLFLYCTFIRYLPSPSIPQATHTGGLHTVVPSADACLRLPAIPLPASVTARILPAVVRCLIVLTLNNRTITLEVWYVTVLHCHYVGLPIPSCTWFWVAVTHAPTHMLPTPTPHTHTLPIYDMVCIYTQLHHTHITTTLHTHMPCYHHLVLPPHTYLPVHTHLHTHTHTHCLCCHVGGLHCTFVTFDSLRYRTHFHTNTRRVRLLALRAARGHLHRAAHFPRIPPPAARLCCGTSPAAALPVAMVAFRFARHYTATCI